MKQIYFKNSCRSDKLQPLKVTYFSIPKKKKVSETKNKFTYMYITLKLEKDRKLTITFLYMSIKNTYF